MQIRAVKFFLLAAVFIVAISANAEDRKTKKYIPDIATFLNIGACSPAAYSWDGKDVYFMSSMSGAPQVYRLTHEGWPYQLTTFDDGIEFFDLSHDGTQAIVGASVGGDENAQLYWMDVQTGRLDKLTVNGKIQYGSATWSHDDKYIFYRSNEENLKDFFIYKMDIAAGGFKKIFGDTTKKGINGSLYISALSEDDSKMIVGKNTSNVNGDLYWLDLTNGKWQHLTPHKGDVSYGSTTIMQDNKTVYLTSNATKSGMSQMAMMTIGGKNKIEFINDGWLDTKWECEGFGFSRDFKYQVASTNEDGYNRMHIREWPGKKPLPNPPLDGLLGGGIFAGDGSCLISFSGPTRAPDVWKWNPKTQELKQLTFSIYAGIDRNLFTEPKLIRYKSFDGLEIPAFLYLPPDYKKGEPIPFIVDAHGGPESQFQPGFIRNFQYLMLNGFGLIAPNPRGSSGYGIDYLNLDNYKKRKDSLKDYKAAVDWLIANGYTQKGMIGIRGGSYGGYVTLGMITEYPDLFSAAIDNVGIANFQTFLQNTAAYRRALREAEYGPLSDPEFLKSISPIHKAHLIKTPLLVVHGANDPRVPVGEARQIVKAVNDNGGIADSLIFMDEGHGSGKRVNAIIEYRKQVEWFNKYLKKQNMSSDAKKEDENQ